MQFIEENTIKHVFVVGDRVLIKPSKESQQTKSGLYLPPGVKEKEKVQTGVIVKAGPGYPLPFTMEDDQPWKDPDENVKYLPLQVKEGDTAVFLQSGAYEVNIADEKYLIVSQSSILMLVREGEKLV